jgi:hypothetical protein
MPNGPTEVRRCRCSRFGNERQDGDTKLIWRWRVPVGFHASRNATFIGLTLAIFLPQTRGLAAPEQRDAIGALPSNAVDIPGQKEIPRQKPPGISRRHPRRQAIILLEKTVF